MIGCGSRGTYLLKHLKNIASGRCEVDSRLRVRRYPVRVEGDELVVRLDAAPPAGC